MECRIRMLGLDKEIMVYCDSGRVASAWWFILSEVLGYKNVKNYDGKDGGMDLG